MNAEPPIDPTYDIVERALAANGYPGTSLDTRFFDSLREQGCAVMPVGTDVDRTIIAAAALLARYARGPRATWAKVPNSVLRDLAVVCARGRP